MYTIAIFVLLLIGSNGYDEMEKSFLGCYQDMAGVNLTYIDSFKYTQCIDICSKKYYKYAIVRNETSCFCGNYVGSISGKDGCNSSKLYFASNVVVGPPRNFHIANITDTHIHLTWNEPESFANIDSYKVKANVLHTHATYKLSSLEWTFSNNTFQAQIPSLHPGTRYNITLQGIPSDGDGAVVYQVIETKIGEPDEIPDTPSVISRMQTTMIVRFKPVTNNNGPITSYLVIVVNTDSVQVLEIENLKGYKEALNEGLSYYISAEIQPQDISKEFVIGDDRWYGEYYNAPLLPNADYSVLLGVKSQIKDITKIIHSNQSEFHNDVLKTIMITEDESSPAIIIILSIAIGLLSVLLIIGIIGFVVLRNRIVHRQRQRLNDNQELTFQGPMISVENNAYVPEDEVMATNHYENLNDQVWIISRNLLNIQHTCLLGQGKFGMIHSGTVHKDNILKTVAVYSIADGKLQPADKRAMLKDLDMLIRAEKHENVLELIGTCESMDTVCVVLEYVSTNLKELLLGCRNNSPGSFCNVSNSQLMDIAINITKGMCHLESKNIIHKQLCARNISIINGFTPKISGFGLAQYYENDMTPIYTRWTAKEVFKGQPHVTKSDVWSFAILLWEICALGGTPYGNIPNNEIPERVIRNQLLKQMQYIGDNLFQLMLNCWQFDLDERPTFSELTESLYEIKEDKFSTYLCLDTYPGFQYEQYCPELEITKNK